jgi:hypothetical protein
MRLLEPLQGIKVTSGHAVFHLAAFIYMVFMNQYVEHQVPIVKSPSKASD